jgi:hypothetical protein
MSIAERVAALSPGKLSLATAVAAIGGLAGAGIGFATGNVPLVIASYAVTFGAYLLPAVADWCCATAAVEAARRQCQEQMAIDTPERCVETASPSREEALAKIRAYYAPLELQTGSGRFRERLSAEDEPGWDRVH